MDRGTPRGSRRYHQTWLRMRSSRRKPARPDARPSRSADRKTESENRARNLWRTDRKSTRLNSSHLVISYAVFCLKKKKICVRDTTLPHSNRPMQRLTSSLPQPLRLETSSSLQPAVLRCLDTRPVRPHTAFHIFPP